MKLFGGFHGNRTKGTAKQPIPEETKEPVRKEPVPAQQAPAKAPEAAAPAAAEETRRIETISEVGAAASAKAEAGPQAPAKAPEAAAPTAAAEETRRIETISDAGARSPAQPEAAPAKPEEKRADTDAKPASDKRGKGLEKTRVFPAPETENEAGGAGEPGTGENPEKTIVFRTPAEEAEIEEIIADYQKKKKRRRIIVLAVLAALVIGGFVLWKSLVKPPEIVQPTAKPTTQPTVRPTATAKPENPDVTAEPDPPEETPLPERMRRENVYTIMLVGRDQGLGNTDTIMVGVFDVDAGTVNVVSIPRDTCANVESDPNKTETKKISGVYSRADFDGLRDAVSDMVGFPIDCYVSVSVNGFVQLVQTIGGVYFNVPHYMNYDDPTQNLHIHFSPGEQYLDGYDAIKVVRWRQNNDGTNYGDIDRINTQQEFLKTVFKKCLSLENLMTNLDDYIKIFQEYVKTDLSTGNMTWFAKEILKLKTEDIHFFTMPSNYNDSIGGFSYGTVLVDEWLTMLNESFNPYDQPIELEDVDLIYRDENGTLCATSGEIKGGMDSFLTMDQYLRMLRQWNEYQESQNKKNEESAASGGDSAPPAEGGDTNGGE